MRLTRRQILAKGSMVFLGTIAGCGEGYYLKFKYGSNVSDEWLGNQLNLKNANGKVKKISDYWWYMPMVFFGFAQGSEISNRMLARAVEIKQMMGVEGDRLQVIFITLDPEKDTPDVLKRYVGSYDPSFEALTGTLSEIEKTTKAFKVLRDGDALGRNLITSRSMSYVFDSRGNIRLTLPHTLTAEECTEDLLMLMDIC